MENMHKIWAENLSLSSPGLAELRYLVLKRFSSMKLYLHTEEPQLGMYSALSLLGARRAGSSDTTSFFQKVALDTQKNPIPDKTDEGSPKTAIIHMLSFFSAVPGENNSVPAHCP